MDYYYLAADDRDALGARDLPAGPVPDTGFETVAAKDVMACPHLEQLVAFATGKSGPSLVPELQVLWPKPPAPGDAPDFAPGVSIMRLPDGLRDDLAGVEMTAAVAEQWAGELWSFEPRQAEAIGEAIVALARSGRAQGKPIYWWSEL